LIIRETEFESDGEGETKIGSENWNWKISSSV